MAAPFFNSYGTRTNSNSDKFSTHMEELRENTNEFLYEGFRASRLMSSGGVIGGDKNAKGMENNPLVKLDEERHAHEAKMSKMESEMKAVFQQKVAERELKLKQSEDEVRFILLCLFIFNLTISRLCTHPISYTPTTAT